MQVHGECVLSLPESLVASEKGCSCKQPVRSHITLPMIVTENSHCFHVICYVLESFCLSSSPVVCISKFCFLYSFLFFNFCVAWPVSVVSLKFPCISYFYWKVFNFRIGSECRKFALEAFQNPSGVQNLFIHHPNTNKSSFVWCLESSGEL